MKKRKEKKMKSIVVRGQGKEDEQGPPPVTGIKKRITHYGHAMGTMGSKG